MAQDIELDTLDRRILAALQRDGRSSYEQLGAEVGLSPSAVLRRVRRLEADGVIAGYAALLRPERVGLGLTAFINVRMSKQGASDARSPMELFDAAVQTWPEVAECVALSGEMDYLLRVVVRDMAHHSRFVMDTLLRHPSVQDCRTSFVMNAVKSRGALAL